MHAQVSIIRSLPAPTQQRQPKGLQRNSNSSQASESLDSRGQGPIRPPNHKETATVKVKSRHQHAYNSLWLWLSACTCTSRSFRAVQGVICRTCSSDRRQQAAQCQGAVAAQARGTDLCGYMYTAAAQCTNVC